MAPWRGVLTRLIHSVRKSAVYREEGLTMQDPVCGMTVEPHQAAGTDVYNGTTYAFCSRHCLEKFRADPAQYVAPAHDPHAGTPAAGTGVAVPMAPRIVGAGARTCAIRGRALELPH